MSYYALVNKSLTTRQNAADELHTALTTMGWTVHDTQTGATPPYRVYSSTGENGDRPTVYVRIIYDWTSNEVQLQMYLYWNNSTQTGTVRIGSTSYYELDVYDSSAYNMWIYGDKDGFAAITKKSTTYMSVEIDYMDTLYNAVGTLQSGVSSGSSVVLQLDTGEAANFITQTGINEYQIAGSGSGEGRERPSVTAVDTGTDQITVDSLARSYSSGSRIGRVPFPWAIVEKSNTFVGGILINDHTGTSDESSTIYLADPFTYGNFDPNVITGSYDFWYPYFGEGAGVYGFASKHKRCYITTSNEHTLSITEEDSGTSTGSNTTTTLNDTGQSWTTNEWDGYCLIITDGTGAGQMREITSNTATALTVATWDTTPDATSDYVICKKGYRYFYFASNGRSSAYLEVDGGV